MDRPTAKDIARFFDKVQITKHCWLWIASKNKRGYGGFGFNSKALSAHRFSYIAFVAPIKSNKYILHRRECGNPSCVNPNHLYMGTQKDNMRDMRLWGKTNMHGKGKTRCAKLSTNTTGQRICQLRIGKHLSQKQLANKFGMHRYTVICWEDDRWLPTWANLQQLAEHFGVSVKFLLYGDNDKGGV